MRGRQGISGSTRPAISPCNVSRRQTSTTVTLAKVVSSHTTARSGPEPFVGVARTRDDLMATRVRGG